MVRQGKWFLELRHLPPNLITWVQNLVPTRQEKTSSHKLSSDLHTRMRTCTHTHTPTTAHAHCSTHYKFKCNVIQNTKKYILVDPGFISVAGIRCQIKKHLGEEKVSLATIPACGLSQQGSQGSRNLKSQWHHMYSQEQRGECPATSLFCSSESKPRSSTTSFGDGFSHIN